MSAVSIGGIVLLIIDTFTLKATYLYGDYTTEKASLLRHNAETLALDCVAVVALAIPYIASGSHLMNVTKVLFACRLGSGRRIERQVHNSVDPRYQKGYLSARVLCLLVLVSHYIGCGFYAVSYAVYSSNIYGPNTPYYCWIYNSEAYPQLVILESWFNQYLYAMYFSIATMTTIAYGDITPHNAPELLYICFALPLFCLAINYFLALVIILVIPANKYSSHHPASHSK